MKRPLLVINNSPEPEGSRKRMREAGNSTPVVRCPSCTGLALIEIKLGMVRSGGKLVGGQKQTVCATCLSQGRTVIVA